MEKKFISSVFYPLSILYFWCNIFAKKKIQSQLLFSILNNCNIYKLFRITNTHTHTLTHTHTWVHFSSRVMLDAGRGNEPSEPAIRQNRPCLPRVTPSCLPPLPQQSALPGLYRVKVISFYHYFYLNYKLLKSISRHDSAPISVILVVESSFII